MNAKFKSDATLIGKRIAMARKSANLTQEKLANNVGIVTKHLSEIERGISGVAIGTLIEIAKCLNVSTDYILLGNESTNSPISKQMQKITPCQKQYLEEIIQTFIKCCLENNSAYKE